MSANPNTTGVPTTRACATCGAVLPASLLSCPTCGHLVHADALKQLAAEAERHQREGQTTLALETWRRALDLLPGNTRQYGVVTERVEALSAIATAAGATTAGTGATAAPVGAAAGTGAHPPRTGWRKWAAGLGAVGILLAKFKWVLLFMLAKGKVLLVGLTQAKTFLSMALALGVYATVYGWRFALGLVVSIYIHEMGHVAWLRRYGIAASAPMFIPGLGAFVRLKQHPATVGEDARVGLAGPIWGAAAALVALGIGLASGHSFFIAIARVGAWINLFNLIPFWQLDGGRGFAALSRRQRGLTAAALWLLALMAGEGMLFLLAIAASVKALQKPTMPDGKGPGAPIKGDREVLITYLVLVVGLTMLTIWGGTPIERALSAGAD